MLTLDIKSAASRSLKHVCLHFFGFQWCSTSADGVEGSVGALSCPTGDPACSEMRQNSTLFNFLSVIKRVGEHMCGHAQKHTVLVYLNLQLHFNPGD